MSRRWAASPRSSNEDLSRRTPRRLPASLPPRREALNVFDFEEAAHRKVRDSHWAYMVSGVDDDATLRANREGYQHVQLRPRRLRDATKVDMHVELFGTVYDSPIFLVPHIRPQSVLPGR